jgi:hypothetical protein
MKPLLLILLISWSTCFGQRQERQVLVYNIGLGGFTSGIGAIINTTKGSSWKKNFVRAFWKGSIGGLLHYTGKKTVYLNNLNQTTNYFWPAKIIHSAGSSIIENAALNKPFLHNWNIDYGPLRFDFSIHDKKQFKVRFLPTSIYAILAASKFGKFNFKYTLQTGNVVFLNKDLIRFPNGGTEIGLSFGRAIVFVDNPSTGVNKYKLLAHEIIHQFQYNDAQVINTWFKPVGKEIKSKLIQRIFANYIYTDIPYQYLAYYLAGYDKPPYYFRNIYEFEAERFSTNKYVFR